MKQSTVTFLLAILFIGCKNQTNHVKADHAQRPLQKTRFDIAAVDTKLPLHLETVDLSSGPRTVQLNDGIVSRIAQTIQDYADSIPTQYRHTFKDVYINTIRLHDARQTLFVVLLKHPVTNDVSSRILFYDNQSKTFADKTFDFNLWALYDFHEGRLIPSNLKKSFRIKDSEIEAMDYNKDKINDYKFVRLFHNGTFSALRTTILTVKDRKIDTLYFDEKIIGDKTLHQ